MPRRRSAQPTRQQGPDHRRCRHRRGQVQPGDHGHRRQQNVAKTAAIKVTGAKDQCHGAGRRAGFPYCDRNGSVSAGRRQRQSHTGQAAHDLRARPASRPWRPTGTNGEYDFVFRPQRDRHPSTSGLRRRGREHGVGVHQLGFGVHPEGGTTVRSASVSANPAVVAINTGSTSNRAEVRALFPETMTTSRSRTSGCASTSTATKLHRRHLHVGHHAGLQRCQRRGHRRLRAGIALQPDRWRDGACLLGLRRLRYRHLPERGTNHVDGDF